MLKYVQQGLQGNSKLWQKTKSGRMKSLKKNPQIQDPNFKGFTKTKTVLAAPTFAQTHCMLKSSYHTQSEQIYCALPHLVLGSLSAER